MHDDDETEGDESGPRSDPLADLLFGLIAIVIPAIAVMLPMIQVAAGRTAIGRGDAADVVRASDLRIDGRPAGSLVAAKDGVRLDGGRLVPLAQLLDDQALRQNLAGLRARGEALLVMIDDGGEEAAFLLETVLAAHGPARILQTRLDPGCRFARGGALADACLARGVRSVRP